jgi:hypothetical protein
VADLGVFWRKILRDCEDRGFGQKSQEVGRGKRASGKDFWGSKVPIIHVFSEKYGQNSLYLGFFRPLPQFLGPIMLFLGPKKNFLEERERAQKRAKKLRFRGKLSRRPKNRDGP